LNVLKLYCRWNPGIEALHAISDTKHKGELFLKFHNGFVLQNILAGPPLEN